MYQSPREKFHFGKFHFRYIATGMENAAYSYSLADVLFLDGRPFRVVASLRRIFQQLDARRTVRQVYPGGTVVSNDPYRHPPPRSVVLRVLFRVTSNSKRFAFVHPLDSKPTPLPLDRVARYLLLPSRTSLPSQKGVFLSGIGFAQRALNRNSAAH